MSQGVLRTASERYDPYDLNNELAHLTNHCVQEKGPNFSKYESGNEMWCAPHTVPHPFRDGRPRYHQFHAYLDKYHPGYHFRDRVIPDAMPSRAAWIQRGPIRRMRIMFP